MRFRSIRSQSGAIFANLALGTAALGSAAAVTVDWTAQQSALALQKQQGYILSRLNDAVGNYMTLLFPQLTEQKTGGVDAIPVECANLPYRYGTSAAVEPVILAGKCQLSLPLAAGGSYVLKNALQPTLEDFKALNLLDHGISDTPVLTTEAVIAGPDTAGAASTASAPNGYAISIQPKCIGKGSTASTCTNLNKALSSSVLNIQPFVSSRYIQNFLPLMWSAGPDAAMSGPPDASNIQAQADRTNPNGEFRSIQAGWTRDNPITREWKYSTTSTTTQYSRGVDNLVLIRNGYDSAYWQMVRRDGSSPPTATWDFNGQDLKKVGLLTAASAEISGDLKVGGNQTVTGNQAITGDQTVTGKVKVDGTGTFKGVLTAMSDLFVEGATTLKGKLTVAGKALFKEDVTLQKNLEVRGSASIDGDLTAASATFNGALLANSLMIGGTQITPDGTLLGATTGWGVTVGASCSVNLALAQSTDGKVQICRNAAWTPLITAENIVQPTPAPDKVCSPEGAPGRLPDGTLAVCTNGKWESVAQGSATEGSACMVEGALATTTASPSPGRILMACKEGKWTTNVFAKPRLDYATDGNTCQTSEELALDGRGYPSLLVCKDGKWQPPGTQLLHNMQKGKACTLDGVLASDIDKTGLLVCKDSIWSKLTDPVELGASCSPNDREVTLGDGDKIYCVNGKWSDMPGQFVLYRMDGQKVMLNRPIKFGGEIYGVYNEYGSGNGNGFNKSQSIRDAFSKLLTGTTYMLDPANLTTNNRTSIMVHDGGSYRGWKDEYGRKVQIQIVTASELFAIHDAFGGRPPAWRVNFQDGSEIWTATRRDECGDGPGCAGQAWGGGGGGWWDHVTVDLNNRLVFHRYNSDAWAVIMKLIPRY
ncbi:bactofilin family protein [Leptothrix sp. BB-4]